MSCILMGPVLKPLLAGERGKPMTLAIVALETATARPIVLVTKSLSLYSSMSLILAMYFYMSVTRQKTFILCTS